MRTNCLKKNPERVSIPALLTLIAVFVFVSGNLYSQSGIKWSVGGNGLSAGDFFGSTNNFPLLFRTNNVQQASLSASGVFQLNNLAGTGTRLLTTDANGNISYFNWGSSTQVLYGNGTWGALPSSTPLWNQVAGSTDIFAYTRVGIGTNIPQYNLEVKGTVGITNSLSIGGLSMFSFQQPGTSGLSLKLNSGFIVNGDFNSSTLNVAGASVFNDKILANRIMPLSGDSAIHFGDSSYVLIPNQCRMYNDQLSAPYRGITLGIGPPGLGSIAFGQHSTAIGYNVRAYAGAVQSIVMGSGDGPVPLVNNSPNTLMVGFNSNKPSLYVGPSYGLGTTGHVGIGTTDPVCKLDVFENRIDSLAFFAGDNATRSLFIIPHVQAGGYNPLSQAGDLAIFFRNGNQNSGQSGLVIGPHSPSDFGMRIGADGKVGIGTTNTPGNYRLYVKEGILTERLKVALITNTVEWGDYVFTDDYKRMNFKEQADYYKKNHHLLGVPSAEELKKGGIDVGTMFTSVVVNLEEARLDAIEVHKENVELKKENAELKESMEQVKKEIENMKKQFLEMKKGN